MCILLQLYRQSLQFSFLHSTRYPSLLCKQRQCEVRSLPSTSTHDKRCESNPRPFDLESNALSTRPHVSSHIMFSSPTKQIFPLVITLYDDELPLESNPQHPQQSHWISQTDLYDDSSAFCSEQCNIHCDHQGCIIQAPGNSKGCTLKVQ